MRQIDKNNISVNGEYFDKVFGCYLGKSIGGVFGAPFEGMKQRIDVKFDWGIAKQMLANDDLDLQVLFFEAVKRYGMNINSYVLAKYFYERYPISPGEYAYFKKNFERGINPPYSGSFNNDFYSEGMGCCIRGELWGCLFPGNPELAMRYAGFDGCMDHSRESVISEYFVSAAVSLAFNENDIHSIVKKACDLLPESRFKRMITDVAGWCGEEDDHLAVLEKIISVYGHPDCTNVFQNMGIVLIGLLKFSDDFIGMCEKINGCGFDTDCTVGLCASIYGVLNGAKTLQALSKIDDVELIIEADCCDYDKSVRKFALTVTEYGELLSGKRNAAGLFERDVLFSLEEYRPVMQAGEEQTVRIKTENLPDGVTLEDFTLMAPAGFYGKPLRFKDGSVSLLCGRSAPAEVNSDKNLFTLSVNGAAYGFGFYVPDLLYVSRPYFENFYNIEVGKYSDYKEYFNGFPDKDNAIRNYHLSYDIEPRREYEDINELTSGGYRRFYRVEHTGDKLEVGELTSYQGPCVLYVAKEFYSQEAKAARLIAGASDYMEIYLNGVLLVKNEKPGYFTFEKFHVPEIKINKGKNVFIYKIVRYNKNAEYSAIITEQGSSLRFPKHMLGFTQQYSEGKNV